MPDGQKKPWEQDYPQAQTAPWQQDYPQQTPTRQEYTIGDILGGLTAAGGFGRNIPAQAYSKLTAALPTIGGTVGGILGGGAGGGVASIPFGVAGAALGGTAGEAARQLINQAIGAPTPQTPAATLAEMGKQAGTQAGAEALGAGTNLALRQVAGPLARSAEAQMTRFLGPRGEEAKAIAQKVVPGLLERRTVALTRQGFADAAEQHLTDAAQALDDELAKVPSGLQLNQNGILKALDNAKSRLNLEVLDKNGNLMPSTPQAKPVLEFANGLRDVIQNADPSFTNMRSVRQAWDTAIDAAKGFSLPSDRLQVRVQKYGANAIREELAKATPDLGAVNREFSFWKNVQGLAENMVDRINQKPPSRFLPRLAVVTGFGAGGPKGAAMGYAAMKALQGVTESASWQTMSPVGKNELAKAIMTGSPGAIVSAATRLATMPGEENQK